MVELEHLTQPKEFTVLDAELLESLDDLCMFLVDDGDLFGLQRRGGYRFLRLAYLL